jgi:hypothetical protein
VKRDPLCTKLGGDLARAWPDLLHGVTPGLQVPCADGTTQRLRNPWGWPEPSRLWVRETWQAIWATAERPPHGLRSPAGWAIGYPATDGIREMHDEDKGIVTTCRPSIHMPRWASRITLDVTDVRVQRLQDISEEDARAEGVEAFEGMVNDATLCAMSKATGDTATDARPLFACLWDSINGKRAAWASNPWVWCVAFRRVTP